MLTGQAMQPAPKKYYTPVVNFYELTADNTFKMLPG